MQYQWVKLNMILTLIMLFGHDFFFRLSKTIDDVESPTCMAFRFDPPTLSKGLVCITDIETL